jgi:hypothetical protein
LFLLCRRERFCLVSLSSSSLAVCYGFVVCSTSSSYETKDGDVCLMFLFVLVFLFTEENFLCVCVSRRDLWLYVTDLLGFLRLP